MKQSEQCALWLKKCEGRIGRKLIHEWPVPDTNLTADAYDPITNTIYEYHGDYWHGNPNFYNHDEYCTHLQEYYGDLYNNTIDRENILKDLGYNLIVIWEEDFMGRTSKADDGILLEGRRERKDTPDPKQLRREIDYYVSMNNKDNGYMYRNTILELRKQLKNTRN